MRNKKKVFSDNLQFQDIIRPWQHNVCSPAEAPAEASASSFDSLLPAANLNPNL